MTLADNLLKIIGIKHFIVPCIARYGVKRSYYCVILQKKKNENIDN